MNTPEAREPAPGGGREMLQKAEAALRRLGFARIPPVVRDLPGSANFWVQEAGVPRRRFPVFIADASAATDPLGGIVAAEQELPSTGRRAILVVPTALAADAAWERLRREARDAAAEFAILVVPERAGGAEPHWHAGTLAPRELLRLATGVVVGMFRQARDEEGSTQIDFAELLRILRQRFGVDVHRSLGVTSDEDALFLLYQLALRDAYAPGDPGANLHLLVLKPTGPAARLPWFAA